MLSLTIEDNQSGYLAVQDAVLQHGVLRSSRAGDTLEVPNVMIELLDPAHSIPNDIGRAGLHPAIGYLEGLFLIAGHTDDAMLIRAAPKMKDFAEDSGLFHGAYGRRTGYGLASAMNKLKAEPDTRQAVVNIWDSNFDNPLFAKRDMPCTLSLAFHIRDGALHMTTTMRSNDCWLGWTYDCTMFTMVQMTAAAWLGVEVGTYTHVAHSLHAYVRNVDAIRELRRFPSAAPLPTPWAYSDPSGPWEDVQMSAIALMTGRRPALAPNERVLEEAVTRYGA